METQKAKPDPNQVLVSTSNARNSPKNKQLLDILAQIKALASDDGLAPDTEEAQQQQFTTEDPEFVDYTGQLFPEHRDEPLLLSDGKQLKDDPSSVLIAYSNSRQEPLAINDSKVDLKIVVRKQPHKAVAGKHHINVAGFNPKKTTMRRNNPQMLTTVEAVQTYESKQTTQTQNMHTKH